MLLIAGGAAVAAALGGLLLDDGVEDVEKAVQTGNLPGLNLSTCAAGREDKAGAQGGHGTVGPCGRQHR